jgi:hypothetical protein
MNRFALGSIGLALMVSGLTVADAAGFGAKRAKALTELQPSGDPVNCITTSRIDTTDHPEQVMLVSILDQHIDDIARLYIG